MDSYSETALTSDLVRKQHVHIKPTRGWISVNFRELWAFRELLFFLVWRDVKVRYKQTVLGAAWAVIQPFLMMVVFTLVFGRFSEKSGVELSPAGVPYSIFAFSGLVIWYYFENSFKAGATSLVGNKELLAKIYFPRLVVPFAAIVAPLVDLAIAFSVLLAMMLWYGIVPTMAVLWLPAFLLLAMATALAASTWLSALNVHYRDVGYVIPFCIRLGLFVSPVLYSSASLVENEHWRLLYALNPMSSVVEGFRWALLGTTAPPLLPALVSAFAVAVLLVSGLFYFRWMEGTFADVV